ncbi:uncharacterized protein N7498_007402 [Penicillium cinerascens]|uniref:EGF-like domain-containing protein n=1 Tax=Penicillium cinerascens TaxID=70096 RepID=A0A9W9JNR4_9EURO|nr:uncharacterized protein N7498_007402 [Penicillium cinerascens]KAJ5198285.1 hypothetical protein N7498_007402 [Penicillium cinerascens]
MSSESPIAPGAEPGRKGSVKRARELLEAGVRPTRAPPVLKPPPLRPQTQWPLPASGLQAGQLNPNQLPQQHPGYGLPRGPSPARPPRPSEVPELLSPAVYSARSGQASEVTLNNPYRPAHSFPHTKPPQSLPPPPPRPGANDDFCVSPTSTVGMNSRISFTTADLFRQSTASSTVSVPIMAPVRTLEPPVPVDPQTRTAGLTAPISRVSQARKSSVSPIPESEEFAAPRRTLGSLASSRAIPSSWGSGVAESEILGAYLDDDSDEDKHNMEIGQGQGETLVRNASLGKKHKPTMRTIVKSNPDVPSTKPREKKNEKAATGLTEGAAVGQARRSSACTTSAESCVDPEKPRFADVVYNPAPEKGVVALPKAAPTMSDKRPGGRKPPRLNMDAVRDAETRGSLSSLSDLIHRATKLAANLDRGITGSRADLAADPEYKGFMGQLRGASSSLSDILASFPNPGLAAPDNRVSWPIFFRRSTLRNVEPLGSHDEVPNEKVPVKRRCCGMPRKWFIILCIILFIIVVLAIILPVFLVAVPAQNASNSCAKTTPCQNGGTSVSGGSECSCVCSNGYTGSQCTVKGDSSCVTSGIAYGTTTKNATMGSYIPSLLDNAQSKFGIDLDPVTIMALFSLRNVSCTTENLIVAFDDVARSSSGTRRSVVLPLDLPLADEGVSSLSIVPTVTAPPIVARAMATQNGIFYDNSGEDNSETSNKTGSSTTTATQTSPSATTTAAAKPSTGVPDKVIEFSQTAVLYILQNTGSLESALFSESQISTYLTNSYNNVTNPQLQLLGEFGLDFKTMTISVENSTQT